MIARSKRSGGTPKNKIGPHLSHLLKASGHMDPEKNINFICVRV